MSAFWTVSAVLLLYFTQNSCARLILAKLGDSVVMHPGQTFDSISAIIWKHNMNIIVEWSGANTTCFGGFIGRCSLDKTTGSLIISSLAVEDTGHYNPEIDSKILGVIELWVIKPVPKPTVFLECNKEKSLCDLTCKANITSHFGPVMYRWEAGKDVLSRSTRLTLTKANREHSYVCMLLNPFSNSSSDVVLNPISHTVSGFHPAAVAVPIVLLVLTLFAVGGYVRHRKEKKQAQTAEAAQAERTAMTLKGRRKNGMSLETLESGPNPPSARRFSSARDLYLQPDDERWVQNNPELRRVSRELREFRLQRDI
ncbi:PREDICTED: CD48 antigen-like [Poecilia mexicana]|uniref:CD48 antigen-like n=1 Tax=Poecilia mexicana TaxID=48701 RepID=UPI00072DBC08|nr:PREDICTED: CD48 antigen-like [Poecilia mexicana]XP_014828451.1 PREDICTED: CD48 antigen-like [Poecilia mexicana]